MSFVGDTAEDGEDVVVTAAGLSADATVLLERRLARRRQGEARGSVPRLGAGVPAPMSYGQWRLWFLEQLRPGTNVWNTPIATRLRGPLDVDALRRALELLMDRHRTLRTVYPATDGRPAPVLLDGAPVTLTVEDVAEAQLLRVVTDEVRRGFDLEHDLMLRARLWRLDPGEHVLVLVAHHIACDGWSKRLLVEELGIAYGAFAGGSRPALPELPIEYGDFAAWQRDWLAGETLERLSAWWRECLAGHAPALALPTELERPRLKQYRGAVERLTVPGRLADAVIALGRRERATPFMALMAGFMAFLHARTGQQDLLVGAPSAMRTQPELERIVGLFANTLVYRTDLAGRPSFRELIRRVRETALGVYQHQDLPFEQIVEAVRPKRDPSRNPLVQVNMRVEGREPELRLEGLRSEPIEIDPGLARFDLAIELGAGDDGYEGYLEYDTALFTQARAQAFAREFIAILAGATASPDTRLVELEPVRAVMLERS